MGIALYPFGKEETGDQLLRSADHALYESKSHKADRAHFWVILGD
jgi:GGDEF domain-containing protein